MKKNFVKPKGAAPKANIPGVEVMQQAKQKGGKFAKGGAVAKKAGGAADGLKSGGRADKAARGGSMRGRSPMSSASSPSSPGGGGKASGYFGDQ